ncbi:MAG: alpha/beta hydrolase-fold protein [Planctomycetota bacterium]|jgi:hypothetical protein
MKSLHLALASALILAPSLSPAAAQDAGDASVAAVGGFEVALGESLGAESLSGDLIVAFSRQEDPLRTLHSWFNGPPVLRFSVEGLSTDRPVSLTAADAVARFPVAWDEFADLGEGTWNVMAILRQSPTGREVGLSGGDLLSDPVEISYGPAADGKVRLELSTAVEARTFEETDRIKHFQFVSPALSEFHGFEYTMNAGVLLPADYDPEKRYPVLYSVTGFGGTHRSIFGWEGRAEGSILDQCIVVVPDASNLYGHSVFCNSPSIGPWGDALVNELIPALEKEYGGAGPAHRHVTGGSSGGWSSFWLQVAYPEAFAACWSHVPDPIDFHDFQQINLYEPLEDGSPRNMFVDEAGELRPLARNGERILLTYKDFVQREHVLNPGGQIRSFEGTFSPLDEDGTPRRVFDVATGVIDHEAAQAWRRFDISHILLTQWEELEPRLDGKIHVWAGTQDNFFLEGAVERFLTLAEPAGLLDHMTVAVIEGLPHSTHQPGYDWMLRAIEEGWGAATAEDGN